MHMYRLVKVFCFVILAAVLVGSCSDLALFTPSAQGSVGIKLLALNEGELLRAGDSVTFMIQSEEQGVKATLLEIFLDDKSGNTVWSTRLSSPLTDEELELIIPELDDGYHTLRFAVHGEEGLLEQKELDFFYVDGQYEVLGISSYPPTVMAGHETVVEANFRYPEDADPYVRWSQDGTQLGSGSLSAGAGRITWRAPQKEGVYSIKVEMFPVAPPTGSVFSFNSPVQLAARLYVSSQSFMTEDELGPANSYYSLFHFIGSLADSGAAAEKTAPKEARLTGGASLSTRIGTMGYDLSGGGGIFYARGILPLAEGRLRPCTLTVKLIPGQQNKARELLSVADREGVFRLRLFFDENGQLVATLRRGPTLLSFPSGLPQLAADQVQRIDLSLIPGDAELRALWFHNGRQAAYITAPALAERLPAAMETTIGGQNGFDGIISEMGVYYRDERNRPAVDGRIFRSAMEKQFGSALVLAEGFEGLYLPDQGGWKIEGGDAYLEGGAVLLGTSVSLSLPFFEPGKPRTSLSVEYLAEIPQGSTLSLTWEGEPLPFLVVDPTGQVLAAAQAGTFTAAGSSLKLTLGPGSLTLAGADGGRSYVFAPPSDPNSWLSVTLRSPAKQGPLKVDSILIVNN